MTFRGFGYKKSKGYRNYSASSYDHKSEAWHLDGGANDEGYYYEHCAVCGRETEHDPCSGCCSCFDMKNN